MLTFQLHWPLVALSTSAPLRGRDDATLIGMRARIVGINGRPCWLRAKNDSRRSESRGKKCHLHWY